MSFKMVLKKRWFQVLGIRSRCSPQNLGLYMARVGESSKLKTISFAGQCESVANPSRDSNHVRDKLLTTWEGAIEQVASRNFFVKSCDFLQVATTRKFPFFRQMDELLAGPATKKKIILAGSSVMQLGALLQSNENSIFGLFFHITMMQRMCPASHRNF